MAMTTIRPASVRDADQLARLRWDFRIEGGAPQPTTLGEFVQEMRAFVGDLLADTAVAYARERRASAALLWPSSRSISFYRRAGFGHEDAPLLLSLEGD